MSLNCIIIEDQPPAQRILKKYIGDIDSLQLLDVFSDATKALTFLKENKVDIIFLDIHLPKISGMDFLKILPYRPQVILTTAFPDYALESYEYDVVDYLLKPFSFQRFVQAVSKAERKNININIKKNYDVKTQKNEVFIKSGYEYIKLNISDIKYIKSDADYTEIFIGEKKHLSSEPLRFWANYLDDNQFTRVHKSYLVNTSMITKVSGNRIFLTDGAEIPLGRVFKEAFSKRFLK